MTTRRLTTAQALVQFLIQQHSRRDGVTRRETLVTLMEIALHGGDESKGGVLQ